MNDSLSVPPSSLSLSLDRAPWHRASILGMIYGGQGGCAAQEQEMETGVQPFIQEPQQSAQTQVCLQREEGAMAPLSWRLRELGGKDGSVFLPRR